MDVRLEYVVDRNAVRASSFLQKPHIALRVNDGRGSLADDKVRGVTERVCDELEDLHDSSSMR